MRPKTIASSAAATAARSAEGARVARYRALAMPHTAAAVNIAIQAGTWK
jgi:hypothetical protein